MSRRSRSSEPGTDSDGSGQRYAHRVRRRTGSSGSEPTSAAGPVAEDEDISLFFSPAGSPQEAVPIVPAQPTPPPPGVVAPPPPPPPAEVAPPPPPPAEVPPQPHPPVAPDNDKDVVIARVREGVARVEPGAVADLRTTVIGGVEYLHFRISQTRQQWRLEHANSQNERFHIKSRIMGRVRVEMEKWQRRIVPGLNVAGIWEWGPDRDRDRSVLLCHLKAHAESAVFTVSIRIVDGEDD